MQGSHFQTSDWTASFASRQALEQWYAGNTNTLAARRSLEGRLEQALAGTNEGTIPGYCRVCRKPTRFAYGWHPGLHGVLNWRETQQCVGSLPGAIARIFKRLARGCKLNCRQRLSLDVLEQLIGSLTGASIYLTEHLSPTATALRTRCRHLATSEFLGTGVTGGFTNLSGVRHEDLTSLSFADGTFDAVLSLDVLEHIADYRRALSEIRRVIRPGGRLVATLPFLLNADAHTVRASIRADGTIEHLLPPEYHGDPVNPAAGVLCYYHFGWELLDEMRAAGFADVNLHIAWSSVCGYIGPEHPLIVATA